MAKFLFLCFLLSNTLLRLTNAATNQQPQIIFQIVPSSNPLAQSPSSGRKLGKHHQKHNQIRSSDYTKSTTPTPSEAPQSVDVNQIMHTSSSASEGSNIPISHQRTSVEPQDGGVLGSHHGRVHLIKQHHHSKSIAGAGIILAGLATTFLVSIFCYIRATRRSNLETTA